MNVKEYCQGRKLEMVARSAGLAKQRQAIIAQANSLQAQLNAINTELTSLDIELEVLNKIEAAFAKEENQCLVQASK